MADSSFDIVSKIDRQEVDNALGQAAREVTQRTNAGASTEPGRVEDPKNACPSIPWSVVRVTRTRSLSRAVVTGPW